METLLISIIGLFVTYFIIQGAVKSAIDEKISKLLTTQSAYLKFLAKQGGIANDDINRIVLTEKQYKKKHKKETIDSINS